METDTIDFVEIEVVTEGGLVRYFSLGDVEGARRTPDEPLMVILQRLMEMDTEAD